MFLSTAKILFTPLDANSKDMLPVPENKSRTFLFSKKYLLSKILNRALLQFL